MIKRYTHGLKQIDNETFELIEKEHPAGLWLKYEDVEQLLEQAFHAGFVYSESQEHGDANPVSFEKWKKANLEVSRGT